ncbi:MAG: hypothetical protein FWD18_04850 [Micrococcales bacterium]|nr:hypothetical protein [Micrococcales bacterium]
MAQDAPTAQGQETSIPDERPDVEHPTDALPRTLALPVMTFEPWTTTTITEIADLVLTRAGGARALVLVDGTGGSGKSTFARRLARHIDGAALVSTDDVSWHLHPTRWAREMLEGVVQPWFAGDDVDYRPPGWVAKGREGSITATQSDPHRAGDGVLIIEGVGAGRHALADLATFLVWVSTDPALARERILVRDIGIDGDTREEVAAFLAGWMELEVPFLLEEAPWERADLIVDGASQDPDGDTVRIHHPAEGHHQP